ncbi:gamma carbonic anhydrase family protein [Amycolatopsis roodepoortensis]|uniref:Carbonic anhydrase/acetyltransferase-like protein (Isoleucine patch superfamily) n=1 Tax=Amycolatopsis roodepoortensis TaxID=700274 RepID=A0ABR9LJ33_9PSEU|nr:acyltransferase [Amycolatopsis roodepoortensis]MBE1580302.1 carbonic anhydrase/acetyltransferase-like protein (isoleucine patch superfamily) [Amycolatopsis roodepoortensis]
MRIRHRDREPRVHADAYVAPTATLIGDVEVAAHARVLSGAVLDAEGSRVTVGEYSIIGEHAVLRASAVAGPQPVDVGDHVLVGPHATLLGCTVGRCSYLATAVTVLQTARLGEGTTVAVGALVHARTETPAEYFVPPFTVALGDPVRLLAAGDPALPDAIREVGFAETAFGATATWTDRIRRAEHATETRSAELGAHRDDVVL